MQRAVFFHVKQPHCALQDDEGWLKKAVELRNVRLDVQEARPSGATAAQTAPLLHTPRLQVCPQTCHMMKPFFPKATVLPG